MTEVYHERVFFTGRVQGVGFRYTALQVSREFEVAGFVCNLPDGRVHLEAEGEKRQVCDFIESLQERMHGFIRQTDRIPTHRRAEFSGFEIR